MREFKTSLIRGSERNHSAGEESRVSSPALSFANKSTTVYDPLDTDSEIKIMPQDTEWKKVEQIFNHAILLSEECRNSFVKQTCGDDNFLNEEVVSLLSADAESDKIFDLPVSSLVAKITDKRF